MIEKDEYLNDEVLRELIRHSPLDSPSDDFVDRVMVNIQISPGEAIVKKPYYFYLKAAIPYVLIFLVLIVVIATSDLPIFNWLPGGENLTNTLLNYLGTMFIAIKSAFTSKYVAWGLLISFSAGFLFLIDRLFTRRTTM